MKSSDWRAESYALRRSTGSGWYRSKDMFGLIQEQRRGGTDSSSTASSIILIVDITKLLTTASQFLQSQGSSYWIPLLSVATPFSDFYVVCFYFFQCRL